MTIKATYQEIEISRIADDDHSYLLTPEVESGNEFPAMDTQSLSRQILLNPPLLQGFDNSFRIIAGHGIFQAYKKANAAGRCPCLVLDGNIDPLELLALALENISRVRKASPVEEVLFLEKAISAAGQDKATGFALPLLNITRRYQPKTLLKLLQLNTRQLSAIHEGELEISTAFTLLEIDPAERDEIFSLIASLRLSASNQRKLLRNSLELAGRYSVTTGELLRDPAILNIALDRSLENHRKTSLIMDWFHTRLFPQLSGAEEKFRRFVESLDLPNDTEVEHAPSFEKDSLTFKCTFRDRQALTDKLPELKKIICNQ
ncbi:MAG: hypothetical protein KKG47_10955 [Proteobacteria bacterium]|nr:hypothetical protein [Pseudomonadota bacterium]MBU1738623.1 hypothetical protein [Pseudomonadota bacterium]